MADAKITVDDVANSLVKLGERLESQWQSHGWSADMNAHVDINWTAPSVNLNDLKGELEFAAERVRSLNRRSMTEHESLYSFRLKKRADELAVGNLPSDPGAIIRSVLELANAVFRNISPPPPPPPKVDWENLKAERELLPKDLARRLRHVEARLTELEPRSATIESQIADIEAAHQAAEQLPTDLADLASQKEELRRIVEEANGFGAAVSAASTRAEDARKRLETLESDMASRVGGALASADGMLKRSEQALRGATSVGLANAFDKRRSALFYTGIAWTVGLLIALCGALWVGAERLEDLKEVLRSDRSAAVIWANVLLTVLGVGAPIWFAWLSTKQIGLNFRLAEDYAFKASVSQAYEGYRTEAVEIDPLMQKRLFESALTRLEEPPIRLVDGDIHSGPLAELLSNPSVRKSLEAIPGISEKIIALIPTKSASAAAVVAAPLAAAGAITAAIATDDAEGGVGARNDLEASEK